MELISKITARISNWAAKSLSYAGRTQLVNSVLSSLHVYWCSVFILPKIVVNEVEKLCRNFLGHGSNSSSNGGLVAWTTVCRQKSKGGLGIKDVSLWNKAIQVKHIWELITDKKTLWAIWVTKIKLKKLSFWGITKKADDSWNWRNLLKLRKITKKMVTYQLGDGKKFSFWFDPWCNGSSIVDLFPRIDFREPYISKEAIVSDFWQNGCWRLPGRWNSTMVEIMIFLNRHIAIAEGIPDCICWNLEQQGRFSVKKVYEFLLQPQENISWAKLVWSASNIPRHSFIFWLALHKRLLTRDKLHHWKIIETDICVLCNEAREEIDHLFFDCRISRSIWTKVLWACNVDRRPFSWTREISWFTRKAGGKSLLAKMRLTALAASVYIIWKARNYVIFQNQMVNVEQIFEQIKEMVIMKHLGQVTKGEDKNSPLMRWFTGCNTGEQRSLR